MIQRFDAFVTGITVCYKYIQRIKSAEVTEMGLKGAHVMSMFHLKQHPEGLTASQLCTLCAEDKAAVSRTISFLKNEGFVTSEGPKNYRAVLKLTPAGQTVANQFDDLIADWVSSGGSGLTDQERSDFYRGLSLIANNLRSKMERDLKLNEV
jgi:DNA-binding MarR family transcriptional regulator